jgi:biotin carboxyl carrier protein
VADWHYQGGDEVHSVRVEPSPNESAGQPARLRVSCRGQTFEVEVLRFRDGALEALVDGRVVRARLHAEANARWVQVGSDPGLKVERLSSARPPAPHRAHGEDALTASTPGQVVAVVVSEGQHVERGQALVVLEAMKMEFRMVAPHEGTVLRVGCREGEVVERGRVLVELGFRL